MENGKIQPRADLKPLNRLTQNLKQVITSVRRSLVQNFVQIAVICFQVWEPSVIKWHG